ncbi:hypothetical protein FA95DRAFT_1560744 [Auriscalpium vulgare]|uniref:Uncharacterized protein n=1 Tax=Auriscalpium vulgare TaxID=40419 RepID=A0ACB8RPJ7_9AGAM|nr:hypothetical protein FA95DRAFT_1560744 [Auriscalpium vulgare]
MDALYPPNGARTFSISCIPTSAHPTFLRFPFPYHSAPLLRRSSTRHCFVLGKSPTRSDYITDVWPDVWQWFRFFERFQSSAPEELHIRDDFFNILGQAIWGILVSSPGNQLVLNSPGSMELLVSFWLKEDPSLRPFDRPPCVAALAAMLSDKDNDTVLPRFMACFEDLESSASDIADYVISPLEGASRSRAPDYLDCHILLLMAVGKARVLRDALLHRGAVRAIVHSLLAVAPLFFDQRVTRRQSAFMMATLCFHFFLDFLETGNAIRWTRSAIRGGLMTAFGILGPIYHSLDATLQSSMLTVLCDIIPRYSLYASVILPIARDMRRSEMQSCLTTIPESPLKTYLAFTSEFSLQRLHLKHQWDNSSDTGYCDACETRAPRSALKRCARCRSVMYCSEACQVNGWPSHKHECTDRAEWSTSDMIQLSTRNRKFHSQCVLADARNNLKTLRAGARTNYPDTTLTDLGILIDYLQPTPRFSVFPVDDGSVHRDFQLQETTGTRWESVLTKAGQPRRRGRSTLIESRTCLGEKKAAFITLVVPALWTDNEDSSLCDTDFRIVDAAAAYGRDRVDENHHEPLLS